MCEFIRRCYDTIILASRSFLTTISVIKLDPPYEKAEKIRPDSTRLNPTKTVFVSGVNNVSYLLFLFVSARRKYNTCVWCISVSERDYPRSVIIEKPRRTFWAQFVTHVNNCNCLGEQPLRSTQCTNVFSYLRTLTTWHCPHSPAAAAASDRYLLSQYGPMQSSKHAAAGLLLSVHTGADRRTNTVPFHRPCSACHATSVNKKMKWTDRIAIASATSGSRVASLPINHLLACVLSTIVRWDERSKAVESVCCRTMRWLRCWRRRLLRPPAKYYIVVMHIVNSRSRLAKNSTSRASTLRNYWVTFKRSFDILNALIVG